jgi:hypothetical protein
MAKSRQEIGNPLTIVAAEALTANRFVTWDGKHTANDKIAGVALFETNSGSACSVQYAGIAVVEAAGSITAGSLVASDADGKATSLSLAAVSDVPKIAGVAIDGASAAGEMIRVLLRP